MNSWQLFRGIFRTTWRSDANYTILGKDTEMAAFEVTRAPYTAANRGLISTFFSSAIAAFVAWNDERATRNALGKLSNRELDDIGLIRGDIDAIARKASF